MYTLLCNDILCPFDINDPPRRSIDFVRQICNAQSDVNIHFLYVEQFIPVVQYPQQTLQPVFDGSITPGPSIDTMTALHDFIAKDFTSSVNYHTYVESGDITRMIHQYARMLHIDLIVLETHPRDTLFDILTLSIPQKVIRHALCPVIVLP